MKKYIVTFEFQNGLGEWVADCMTNNGAGFTEEDARYVAWQIACAYNPTRYVEVREVTK